MEAQLWITVVLLGQLLEVVFPRARRGVLLQMLQHLPQLVGRGNALSVSAPIHGHHHPHRLLYVGDGFPARFNSEAQQEVLQRVHQLPVGQVPASVALDVVS